MAIQFNCPGCGALIRVPDAAAGRQGTCPRCSERLLVPNIGASEAPAGTVETAPIPDRRVSGGDIHSSGLPPLGGLPSLTADEPDTGGLPELAFPANPKPAASPAVAGLPELQTASPTSISSSMKMRSLQAKRRQQGNWIFPAICIAIVAGFIGWYVWNSQPKLEGQLSAHVMHDLDVKPGLIPGEYSGLQKDDLGEVLRHLRAEPMVWSSTASRMTMTGADEGVEVTLKAGSTSHFVGVQPGSNPAVVDFVRRNSSQLEKDRTAALKKQAPALFAAWKDQFDRHIQITDQKTFRDQVCLPALVSGLGYHVEALVNGHSYPCVYEDEDGTLYFLLPNATKSFVLKGHRVAGGISVPIRFEVKITSTKSGKDAISSSSRKKPRPKTREEREAENQGMNPDLYKSDADESPEKPASETEALKRGLDEMLPGSKSSKTSRSKTTKKPGMMDEMNGMEEPGEMSDDMPEKSMPKKKPKS